MTETDREVLHKMWMHSNVEWEERALRAAFSLAKEYELAKTLTDEEFNALIQPFSPGVKMAFQAYRHQVKLARVKFKKRLPRIIRDWFVALEKKQSSKQIKEVAKKGLWNADLISASFEEIMNGLSQALIDELEIAND